MISILLAKFPCGDEGDEWRDNRFYPTLTFCSRAMRRYVEWSTFAEYMRIEVDILPHHGWEAFELCGPVSDNRLYFGNDEASVCKSTYTELRELMLTLQDAPSHESVKGFFRITPYRGKLLA